MHGDNSYCTALGSLFESSWYFGETCCVCIAVHCVAGWLRCATVLCWEFFQACVDRQKGLRTTTSSRNPGKLFSRRTHMARPGRNAHPFWNALSGTSIQRHPLRNDTLSEMTPFREWNPFGNDTLSGTTPFWAFRVPSTKREALTWKF